MIKEDPPTPLIPINNSRPAWAELSVRIHWAWAYTRCGWNTGFSLSTASRRAFLKDARALHLILKLKGSVVCQTRTVNLRDVSDPAGCLLTDHTWVILFFSVTIFFSESIPPNGALWREVVSPTMTVLQAKDDVAGSWPWGSQSVWQAVQHTWKYKGSLAFYDLLFWYRLFSNV